MKKFVCTVMGFGLVVAFSGCGNALVGTWRTESVDPPESAKHFRLAKVTFNDDGTYNASATYEGKSKQDSGSYKFNGFKLTLDTKDGKIRTYGATYNAFTSTLTMTSSREGRKVKAVLAKEKPAGE